MWKHRTRNYSGRMISLLRPGLSSRMAAAAVSSLLTGLVSYWKLEEASGTRVDQLGLNDLTPVNTPGNAAGKQGNAIALVAASTQYTSKTSPVSIPLSGSFTLGAWVNPTTNAAGGAGILDCNDTSGFILRTVSGTPRMWVAGSTVSEFSHTGGAIALGAWSLILGWWDAVATTLNIEVNGVLATSSAGGAYSNAGGTLFLGARNAGSSHWDGLIDEGFIYNRLLTAPERTQLYNGGAGITYPFS